MDNLIQWVEGKSKQMFLKKEKSITLNTKVVTKLILKIYHSSAF